MGFRAPVRVPLRDPLRAPLKVTYSTTRLQAQELLLKGFSGTKRCWLYLTSQAGRFGENRILLGGSGAL